MYPEIKVAIYRSGLRAYQVAYKLDWHPSKLSQVISGIQRLSWTEKKALAEVLGASVGEIFREKAVSAHSNHTHSPEAVCTPPQ